MNIIMETRNYWEENGNSVKYDNYNSNDGFGRAGEQLLAPPSEDEAEYPPGGAYLKKGKVSRQDPMSHRIIEKRRRDRMNNCLADLSRLIPPEYLKKGRGRVEKTEIIEMAIRHLKYLQDRVDNTNVKPGEDHFRAGYQDAVAEVLRFLVESHGYGPADGLCVQLAAHMQRHCEHFTKGVDKPRSHPGSSSETNSSSGSSHGYVMQGVIQTPVPPRPFPADTYERPDYPLNDRVTQPQIEGDVEDETMPLDGRRNREPTLREVRKPEHDDYLHSYKFKNSIERRFSRSQDTEAVAHTKQFAHKRRRALKPAESCSTSAPSTTSASGSNEDAQDTSPQDTSSESPHHHHFDNPPPAQYVPVFALNAHGKYYVPISVDYACIARHLGAYDMLESRAAHLSAPLHPVTIHVNFQPCLNYHVKREATDTEWRPA